MRPEDKRAALEAAAGTVSRETFGGLLAFEAEFLRWNARINLAADADDLWTRHIVDSAQLWPLAPGARTWLDLGSGGGFPGLVIAFLLRGADTGGRIHLVESNRKKAGFLQAMIGLFRLPAMVHAIRIDAVPPLDPRPDVVTARALASLDTLLELSFPWLPQGATGLFHKGRDYRREVEESAHRWRFDLVERPSVTDPSAAILCIEALARR